MIKTCDECGHNLSISFGPGRFRMYRGHSSCEIPADLEFFECLNCGAEWMDASQIDYLSEAFEKLFSQE